MEEPGVKIVLEGAGEGIRTVRDLLKDRNNLRAQVTELEEQLELQAEDIKNIDGWHIVAARYANERDVLRTKVDALEAENFALASGVCNEGDDGLVGDDGGSLYCKMRRNLSKALKERDKARKDTAVPGIYALGYALFYFQYCHPHFDLGDQHARVHDLCERWVELREREYSLYRKEHDQGRDVSEEMHEAITKQFKPEWVKLLGEIEEETENLC